MTPRLLLALPLAIPFAPAPSCAGPEARAKSAPAVTSAPETAPAIRWESWSDELFERAKKEHRLVLLDLEAVWCHWCHVMEETTYKDLAVAKLVGERYIAVKVDQDSRPDLSNRYEDYGWPATIVFDANGQELAKRSGYIPPLSMSSMLQAFADDPRPGPSVEPARAIAYAAEASIGAELHAELESAHTASYDLVHGGFGFTHKYLDPPSVEYAILRALEGDAKNEHMAKQTLEASLVLIDPAWGGVYQYSAGGDWKEPHFEKIMSFQADDIRIYCLAYSAWRDPRYLKAAQDIRRFLRDFLTSPKGAFYTSMDADLVQGEHSGEYFALDDARRRERGLPRIDTHAYSRENGWAIRGLVSFYAASGDETALRDARRAAERMIVERSLEGGGFRHDAVDAAGPYLGDTLGMGQAFLALYEATGERAYLARAEQAAQFIGKNFASDSSGAGLSTVRLAADAKSALPAQGAQRDENVAMARFANGLFHYAGKKEYQGLAERAMRYLATPEIARRPFTSSVLLAEREITRDPLHVTVVGAKHDPAALSLVRAALAQPETYRRIEWYDETEGALPNADVEFPPMPRAAAFTCSAGRCSSPAYTPEDIAKRIAALRN